LGTGRGKKEKSRRNPRKGALPPTKKGTLVWFPGEKVLARPRKPSNASCTIKRQREPSRVARKMGGDVAHAWKGKNLDGP